MPEIENTVAEKAELNWDALSSDPVFGEANHKSTEPVKVEDEINKDVVETPEQIAEKESVAKTEAEQKKVDEAAKTATDALKEEAKTLGLPETATKEEIEAKKVEIESPIKFTVEDIKDVPATHPQGSYKALAQTLGMEIAEESIDAFKEKFISKEEAEKLSKVSKETFFSDLDPEVAAALELKELGVPKELILEPTKEIDGYLKMDSAELVRADKMATDGWTPEMIDTEIESLIENGKLEHEASKIRIELNLQKTNILANRANLVQKYTEQKQSAAVQQKEQEKTQVISALNKVSTFAGVPIPKDVMQTFITKYNNGLYDKDLSSADIKANYIIMKELEGKIGKHIQNKASEKAKTELTNKLLNVPPLKQSGGGAVVTNNQQDNWSALEKDFG